MPKVSKATSSLHQVFPIADTYQQEVGAWTVTMEKHLVDMDLTPFFKGLPNDQCQATHLGYVLQGKLSVRKADGAQEIFEAGDAFLIEPGHTPVQFAGCEIVLFTSTEEENQQAPVVMANAMKYAEEHGLEMPAPVTS